MIKVKAVYFEGRHVEFGKGLSASDPRCVEGPIMDDRGHVHLRYTSALGQTTPQRWVVAQYSSAMLEDDAPMPGERPKRGRPPKEGSHAMQEQG